MTRDVILLHWSGPFRRSAFFWASSVRHNLGAAIEHTCGRSPLAHERLSVGACCQGSSLGADQLGATFSPLV